LAHADRCALSLTCGQGKQTPCSRWSTAGPVACLAGDPPAAGPPPLLGQVPASQADRPSPGRAYVRGLSVSQAGVARRSNGSWPSERWLGELPCHVLPRPPAAKAMTPWSSWSAQCDESVVSFDNRGQCWLVACGDVELASERCEGPLKYLRGRVDGGPKG